MPAVNAIKLRSLVDRSLFLLETQGRYYTDGAKLALTDMVDAATQALNGVDRLPFIRNREFLLAREDESILFATKRYTMSPPYNQSNHVHRDYGLEEALAWFEQQDVRNEATYTLQEKAEFVTAKAVELLDCSNTGHEVGQHDADCKERLTQSLKKLQDGKLIADITSSNASLALAIVDVYNTLRDYRHSRILRTDVDSSSSIYVNKSDLQRIKERAGQDVLIKQEAMRIQEIADRYSLDYITQAYQSFVIEPVNYDAINSKFYAWSFTDKIANFKAPNNAVKATISFVLPSEDNESEGLGHVWIDNVHILSASGKGLEIVNSGFEEGKAGPSYWEPQARKGNPQFKWEETYPYCGGGDRQLFKQQDNTVNKSVYLCNPTGNDEGAWNYNRDFAIEGGSSYTLTFAAKLDGKLKKGLQAVVTYKDTDGMFIDRFEYTFNRKSSLPNFCFLLTMQCDAIQYAFTDDLTYAKKAKYEILYTLNDFCQGAEHWMVTNLRPEGSDSYGAVQGGRMLCSIAVTYSLIKDAGVFSNEEKQQFYALISYLLRYMLDLRDRTELSPYEAQNGCSNWQTDMCAGTAYMMLVLEDFPNRKAWLYNAHMVLISQLRLNINPDHSWPESIRYHTAALERFSGYAKVVKHVMGENLFETTPLKGMFEFMLQTQTPPYRYFNHRIGTPPFGDHALRDGSEFACFANHMNEIEVIDKGLADRMYHTWKLAGQPMKDLWGEAVVFENLLAVGSEYKPDGLLQLESSAAFKHAGIYIFRNERQEGQNYFAIMSSPDPIGHGHLDQGSFILYKNSVPLVMDSGIEGYFDSSTNWHISSYSHACLQFQTTQTTSVNNTYEMINLSAGTYSLERGWVDVPKTSSVLSFRHEEDKESIAIEIMNPEGKGKHIRQVTYFKTADFYLIRDSITEFEGEVLFSLPVAADHTVIEGQRVYSTGVYDVDLEVVFLNKVNHIWLDKGRSTPFFDCGQSNVCMMDYIRATSDGQDGFLTLLYPKTRNQQQLRVSMKNKDTAIVSLENEQIEICLTQ